MFRGQRHVERKKSGEGRGGVCRIRHHVQNIDQSPGLQGAIGPSQNVANLCGGLLMQRAKNGDRIIRFGLIRVRVIIPCPAGDAAGHIRCADQFRSHRRNARQIHGHTRQFRIGLRHHDRIRSRPSSQVQDCSARV